MPKKTIYSLGSLVLLLVLFVALSMLSSGLLRGLRFDLTENNLFTLSEGTLNVLAGLQEPITLPTTPRTPAATSRNCAATPGGSTNCYRNSPATRKDKLALRRVDPEPFSRKKTRQRRWGCSAPVGGSGETLYLGIAASNTLDDMQVMPFLQPSRRSFSNTTWRNDFHAGQSRAQKLVLSSLPMQGGFDPATQGMRPAWVLYEQLGQMFDIEALDPGAAELPADLDLLLLVHPKDLNPGMLYSIEQFVLGGGRVVAFLDPFAEADQGDPNDPMARMQAGSSSDLGGLLEAWGVAFDTTRAVGDLQYGIGSGPNRHIGILSVPAAAKRAISSAPT
jgi:ABC-type uncharacterized transport system involved in gliding motility auxiliary subunit